MGRAIIREQQASNDQELGQSELKADMISVHRIAHSLFVYAQPYVSNDESNNLMTACPG